MKVVGEKLPRQSPIQAAKRRVEASLSFRMARSGIGSGASVARSRCACAHSGIYPFHPTQSILSRPNATAEEVGDNFGKKPKHLPDRLEQQFDERRSGGEPHMPQYLASACPGHFLLPLQCPTQGTTALLHCPRRRGSPPRPGSAWPAPARFWRGRPRPRRSSSPAPGISSPRPARSRP